MAPKRTPITNLLIVSTDFSGLRSCLNPKPPRGALRSPVELKVARRGTGGPLMPLKGTGFQVLVWGSGARMLIGVRV